MSAKRYLVRFWNDHSFKIWRTYTKPARARQAVATLKKKPDLQGCQYSITEE